ncbi:MAG TPA: 16S rRNA (cytosine(1402)-N(4))-methyltransferase RsmH [Acidimicrobiia bacterium]|nr:16S rRNA (cytosine(1402)-N(4))-methyltransferase RsmH [Acidimicrobiia bacterium]
MTQDRESEREYHRPVMAAAVSELMRPVPPGVVVDATFGGGGHARELLKVLGGGHRLLGIDRDPTAIARAEVLRRTVDDAQFGTDRFTVQEGNFAHLADILTQAGIEAPVGVLFDFGVSSHHFDEAERGFSYRLEGPLDMRMDPTGSVTAADLVNELEEAELAAVIHRLGEEPAARRIARAIVNARPLSTTTDLAAVIERAVPGGRRRLHPARRTFQALRMAVNGELEAIDAGVRTALDLLAPEGRCITIAYHSLEDRLVKGLFAEATKGCVCPPEIPVCVCGASPAYRSLTRGVRKPSEEEIAANPRARSARLRAVERVAA